MNEKDLINKVNELEVKDDFEKINNEINYQKYTTKKHNMFNFRIALVPIICCVLLLLIIPFLFLNGDDSSSGENTGDVVETPVVQNDGLLYKAADKADLANLNLLDNREYQEFVRKIQLFSARLSVAIYRDSKIDENLCISPISVYMALAMVISSSNGVAQEELLSAVGVTEKEVNDFTKYLYAHLKQEKYTYDYDLKQEVLSSILDLNNSIWINESVKLKDQGLKNLANNFNADSYHIPFTTDNEKANALLSKYIEDKTHGLIKPKLKLNKSTLFALVNTLYMKDYWLACYDELRFTTNEYDFICSNGEIVKTKLMIADYVDGNIYDGDKFQHFYVETSGHYYLKLIVPKQGYTVSDIYNVETLMEVNSITDYNTLKHFTSVRFPAFEASYNGDLIKYFVEEFDVHEIFNEGYHMTSLTDHSLFISDIIHQTKLKADEKGIEGAAVTIAAADGESVPDGEWHEFIVDKAFAYLLTDKYGNILFTGVVNEI